MRNQIDGRPIIDAKHPLSVKITAQDIARSDPKDPGHCAAAVAMRREHKCAEVRIHLGRVYVRQNKGNWTRYFTPAALRSEIIAFDRGGQFEPGEYQLYAPHPSHHARGKRQGGHYNNKRGATRNRKKRRDPKMVANVRGGPA